MEKKQWVRVTSLASDLWTPVDRKYPQAVLGEKVGKYHRKLDSRLPDILNQIGEIQHVGQEGTLFKVRLNGVLMEDCPGDYWHFREEDLTPYKPTEDEVFDFAMSHLEVRG